MIKQRGENEKEEKEKRKRKMRTKIIDGKIAERQEYIFLRLRVVLSHRIAHRQQPNTDDDGDDDWLRAQSARDLFFSCSVSLGQCSANHKQVVRLEAATIFHVKWFAWHKQLNAIHNK